MTAPETIQIRRYPNRRFYDRTRRRYVTSDDIESLVREGRNIEVHDSRTAEDLTRQVLTQILLDRHPDKMELFPSALLHALLRANDLATDLWRTYLRHALATLEGLQRTVVPMGMGLSIPWLPPLLPVWPGATPPQAPGTLAARLAELEGRIARLETDAEPRPGDDPDAGPVERLENRVRDLEARPSD